MTVRITPKESKEQKALKKWCDLENVMLVHIANEGQRHKLETLSLIAQGLRPGFPDNMIFTEHSKVIFIELKQNRKYFSSEMKTETWINQQWWLDWLNANGFTATRCYGWYQAAEFIREHIK